MNSIKHFVTDDSGQDLVEYALLAAFISIVTVASLKLLGTKVAAFYMSVSNAF